MNKLEAICAALLDVNVAVHGGFVSSSDGLDYQYHVWYDNAELEDDCIEYIKVPQRDAIAVSRDKDDPMSVAQWIASLACNPAEIEKIVPAAGSKLKSKKDEKKKKGLSGLKLK